MPCTRYDEQQDQNGSQQATYRSTSFNRSFAGLRFSNQQNLHSFAIQPTHQHHPQLAIAPQLQEALAPNAHEGINQPDDVTEQIRISVQDTHISHGSFINDFGGNVYDVLDSLDESILSFNNNSHLQHAPLEATNSSAHVRSNTQNEQSINRAAPYISTASIPSTSSLATSTTTTSRLVDVHGSQAQSSSSLSQPRNLIVLSNIKSRSSRHRPSARSTATAAAIATTPAGPQTTDDDVKVTNADLSQNDADWSLSDTTSGSSGSDVQRTGRLTSSANEQHSQGNERNLCREKSQQTSCKEKKDDILGKRLVITDDIPIFRTRDCQVTGVVKSYLCNGSSFSGVQQSKENSYEVNVKIQHVDFDQSYLYGYLCISHLTTSHPKLTTFFEGEIISERHPFLTRKWEATSEIDLAHWSRFDGFTEEYARSFTSDGFDYEKLKKSDYIFMRWKEHFLVPDHTVKYVEGASYAGFYYICFNKRTSQIEGYYFHISEHFESFQSLDLTMDSGERSTQTFEFR